MSSDTTSSSAGVTGASALLSLCFARSSRSFSEQLVLACAAVLVAMLATLSPAAGQADGTRNHSRINADIVKASNQLALGLGMLARDYREYNDGLTPLLPDVLDSESGRLTSLRLGYTGLIRGLYLQGHINYSTGDTDYVGYLQSGFPVVYTPFNTTTDNHIFDILARVGYAFRAGERLALVPYGELGDYWWRRDIGPSTPYGLTEDYSHLHFSLGAKILYSPVRRLVLELGGGYGTTFLSTMNTEGYEYELGAKPHIGAHASVDYRFLDRWHLKWSAEYQRWEYGQSDVVAGYLEPHSRTEQTQFLMSVGVSF